MKYIIRTYALIFLIVVLGTIIRIIYLGEWPVGFHRDEAFFGYNAYSLLLTGRDVNSNFLPLHLQSFLYSPAGYSYIAMPFIKIFGLTEFAVRFPSAIFGAMTVLITYILTKKIFTKAQKFLFFGISFSVAEISAFLIAISPWHINLSRTTTENVIVVFLITAGVILWISWIENKKSWLLFISFLLFFLTLGIYQAPRAFLPIFIPFLIALYYKQIKKKEVFITFLLFFITVLIPLGFILSSPTLAYRLRMVSIFHSDQTKLILVDQIHEDGVHGIPVLFARSLHNKLAGYADQFLQNYFKHFSYDFLFTDAAFPDRYRIPQQGLLYRFELPFLLFGLLVIMRRFSKESFFLVGWVGIAPIGAALTFDDVPNMQRTLIMFPAISIIVAIGVSELICIVNRQKKLLWIYPFVAVIVVGYSFIYYLHQYYIHAPVYKPWYRNDGYKLLVTKVKELAPAFKKVIITSRESDPSVFFLFYTSYNPKTFQIETKGKDLKDFGLAGFGKYEFSMEECPFPEDTVLEKQIKLPAEKDILYVNSGLCKIPENSVVLETIKRRDRTIVFYVLRVE